MQHHAMSPSSMQDCIDACTSCHQICLQTALTHCVEMGGKHVDPQHFRLMMNCAEVCQASANLQLSGSAFSSQMCGVCAQVCEACAASCEQIGEMQACAAACRRCAESCQGMANSVH